MTEDLGQILGAGGTNAGVLQDQAAIVKRQAGAEGVGEYKQDNAA